MQFQHLDITVFCDTKNTVRKEYYDDFEDKHVVGFSFGRKTKITIAYEIIDNDLYYGVAYLSLNQKTFNKKVGRTIAAERMQSQPEIIHLFNAELERIEYSGDAIGYIIKDLISSIEMNDPPTNFPDSWKRISLYEPITVFSYSLD